MKKNKEKVLILAYNFPPSTRTSANRAWAWAKYFHEFGYYPIIITRNWDLDMKTHEDQYKSSGDKIKHEKFDNYEVHYLPYQGNLRDKLYFKYKEKTMFKIFSKVYTVVGSYLENYFDFFIPYNNFYSFSDSLLKDNPEIKKMIVTVFPVYLFKFAYKLHKKHKIEWIADYRDDWNTSELVEDKSLTIFHKVLKKITEKKEKQWLSTCKYFSSVSDGYVDKIGRFLLKENDGFTIPNGFFEEELSSYRGLKLYDDFTITYNGTLYPSQNISIFLETVKFLNDKYTEVNIKVNFPGLAAIPSVSEKIKRLTKGFSDHVLITNRIPKEEVLIMQAKSHLLLMVGHDGINNIPSSKIYEYIGLEKKVLVCPTDNGVIESTLRDAGNGFFSKNIEETVLIIENEIIKHINSKENEKFTIENKDQYSRRSQSKIMADMLNRIR